jgi:imidazolonepropionase-like amidohydrolase
MRKSGSFLLFLSIASTLTAQPIAIRAGRLIDPETGTAAANQLIVVENGRVLRIGGAVPANAETIDLSGMSVLPGLVDAHNHLALTYKRDPENNSYYLTSVLDSTALRAIQAVSNGITMMSSGFTDRLSSTQASSSAAWADSSRPCPSASAWSTRSISTPTLPTKSSRPCARTSSSAPR